MTTKRIDDPSKDCIVLGSRVPEFRPTRITFMGETMTVTEWADELGLDPRTIQARIRNGLTPEQCLCKIDKRTTRQKNL
jgi:hypothetical protein